jgi:hypothetical protein
MESIYLEQSTWPPCTESNRRSIYSTSSVADGDLHTNRLVGQFATHARQVQGKVAVIFVWPSRDTSSNVRTLDWSIVLVSIRHPRVRPYIGVPYSDPALLLP